MPFSSSGIIFLHGVFLLLVYYVCHFFWKKTRFFNYGLCILVRNKRLCIAQKLKTFMYVKIKLDTLCVPCFLQTTTYYVCHLFFILICAIYFFSFFAYAIIFNDVYVSYFYFFFRKWSFVCQFPESLLCMPFFHNRCYVQSFKNSL